MLGKETTDSVTTSTAGPWVSVWRIINLCMAVFFSLATAVNVNDGDWYLWVPIYLIPSLLCLVVAANPYFKDSKFWNLLCLLHFTLCLAYAIYQGALLAEALAGQVENPLQHEEGREMGGLFIILTWLGISRFTNLGRSALALPAQLLFVQFLQGLLLGTLLAYDSVRPNASASNHSLMNALLLMTITLAVLPLFLWSLCFVSDWHTKLGHCNGMFHLQLLRKNYEDPDRCPKPGHNPMRWKGLSKGLD